jgi:DNA-dependent RNA polymerase auxiliary subunit epsilon
MKGITAKIKGIKYTPFLCRTLHTFNFDDLDKTLSQEATFILKIDDKNQIALSWWVSAKRTRSYPYARVYDSLTFSGKKVTIIPIVKDEGKDGDRDFLQWDTISLMSLLGVYVIIAYYNDAIPSQRYDKKITEQRFNVDYIKSQMKKLLSYQSDALHWNLSQIDNIAEIGEKALESYEKISQKLNVEMHSKESARARIDELKKGKEAFMALSRNLAEIAQKRESITLQPKEKVDGTKATITITNYLGGNYYFTSDEIKLEDNNIYLIDAKHTKENKIPSLGDIKDGLLKMILFTNLENVEIDGQKLNSIAVLKLTTGKKFNLQEINEPQKKVLDILKKEAQTNKFRILLNKELLI